MNKMSAKEKTAHVTKKAVALIKQLHNPPIGALEFSGGWCPERCDAIMFTSNYSFMIETKVSRSDFLADKKKDFRKNPNNGIGDYRYYACPIGLIKPEELPERWGLIYVDCDNKRSRARMPVGFGGYIRNPKKDTKHPKHGWTVEGYDTFGNQRYSNDALRRLFECDETIKYWGSRHPEQPENKFLFPVSSCERNYLFALATRYKSGEFKGNML